jgi:hypothetical protein
VMWKRRRWRSGAAPESLIPPSLPPLVRAPRFAGAVAKQLALLGAVTPLYPPRGHAAWSRPGVRTKRDVEAAALVRHAPVGLRRRTRVQECTGG